MKRLNRSFNEGMYQTGGDNPNHLLMEPGDTLDDVLKEWTLMVLGQCKGNRTHAATELGTSVRTLHRRLRNWGVN